MLCTRMTTLAFLLLELSLLLVFEFNCCVPLCYWNTHHNILMILGRNVERMRYCVAYKNDNSGGVVGGVGDICFCFLFFFLSKNLF